MRTLILLLISTGITYFVHAATFTSTVNGDWDRVTTWGIANGTSPYDDNADGYFDAGESWDNNTFNVYHTVNFAPTAPRVYNPTVDFGIIALYSGGIATASVAVTDNNIAIAFYTGGSLNASANFDIGPMLCWQGTGNYTYNITVNGLLDVSALYSVNDLKPTFNITAQNVNMSNYNAHFSGGMFQGREITTNITLSPAGGTVSIDNYFDRNGSTLTINDGNLSFKDLAADIKGTIDINNGNLTFPNATTVDVYATANVTVGGNVTAANTIVEYNDAPTSETSGAIVATGTVTFSKVVPGVDGDGGYISGSSITIADFNQSSPDIGLILNTNGPTTITNLYGHGVISFSNGDLTIGTYYQTNNGHINLSSNTNDDVIFNSTVNVGSGASIEVHADNIDINGGVSITSSASNFLFYAQNNVYLGSGATSISTGRTLYFKGNVIQQGNLTISQNSGGAIITQGDWNSNGYSTTFSSTNDMFKIEGDAHFDNISGHLNGNASIAILGDAYFSGTSFGSPNDGNIYISGYATLEDISINFRNSANIYLGDYTKAQFQAAGYYLAEPYDANPATGYQLRDNTTINDAAGNYVSMNGGQFSHAGGTGIGDITTIGAPYTTPSTFPLPIELSYFKAKQTVEGIALIWETKTEKNNDFFTLYKSIDGRDFDILTEVNGAGNSSFSKEYSCTDNSPVPGLNYYKLQQTDYDGKSETFPVISALYKQDSFTLLKTASSLTLYFASEKENQIEISSLEGRLLYANTFRNTEIAEIPNNFGHSAVIIIKNSTNGLVTTLIIK